MEVLLLANASILRGGVWESSSLKAIPRRCFRMRECNGDSPLAKDDTRILPCKDIISPAQNHLVHARVSLSTTYCLLEAIINVERCSSIVLESNYPSTKESHNDCSHERSVNRTVIRSIATRSHHIPHPNESVVLRGSS